MEKELLQILEGRHPSYEMPFSDLLTGLTAEVDAGNVSMKENGEGLQIYCYTMQATIERNWNVFSAMSRGLILDVENKKIVATPFCKFWNFGEVHYIPDEDFVVTEKIDGSMGIVFYHNGRWQVATKGSFQSEQALWAMDYLNKNIDKTFLESDITYLVEIVYAENRIVIPYDEDGLYILSTYRAGFEEALGMPINVPESLRVAGFKVPKCYGYESIDSIIADAKVLHMFEEGFVVRFFNGHRVKIKGDEYCRVHRLISNCTPLFIWDCIRACHDMDSLRLELPEEFHKDFDSIRTILECGFYGLLEELKKGVEAHNCYSDKELGQMMNDARHDHQFSPVVRQFIFASRKSEFLKKVLTEGRERSKMFKLIRPTANDLDGYFPSSVMNRFENEAL